MAGSGGVSQGAASSLGKRNGPCVCLGVQALVCPVCRMSWLYQVCGKKDASMHEDGEEEEKEVGGGGSGGGGDDDDHDDADGGGDDDDDRFL